MFDFDIIMGIMRKVLIRFFHSAQQGRRGTTFNTVIVLNSKQILINKQHRDLSRELLTFHKKLL